MSIYKFFRPTSLYKEFMILDIIDKNKKITQREISKTLGISVSMVNNYLNIFEFKGLVKRKHYSKKTVEYFVTKTGAERKKVLNISYLSDSLKVFKSASKDVGMFLNQIINKGYKKILLYGAGEVAEILLQVILIDRNIPINVLAIIDDNPLKHNDVLFNTKIIPPSRILSLDHDGILISSYKNRSLIKMKLISIGYDETRILHFFS